MHKVLTARKTLVICECCNLVGSFFESAHPLLPISGLKIGEEMVGYPSKFRLQTSQRISSDKWYSFRLSQSSNQV